jgi:hypothetical protein
VDGFVFDSQEGLDEFLVQRRLSQNTARDVTYLMREFPNVREITLTPKIIAKIFEKYPNVERAFKENVPHKVTCFDSSVLLFRLFGVCNSLTQSVSRSSFLQVSEKDFFDLFFSSDIFLGEISASHVDSVEISDRKIQANRFFAPYESPVDQNIHWIDTNAQQSGKRRKLVQQF